MSALTRNQQVQGQRQILLGAAINPLGAGFIMGPVVGLLALHYGASDVTMGFIYAAVYLSGLFAIIAPIFLNGYDEARIFGVAWCVRTIIGGAILILPFLPNDDMKVLCLVLLLYGFCGARAIGAATFPSVTRAFNRSAELTPFLAKIFSRWHFGMLIATIVSYLILSNKDSIGSEEIAYMVLIGLAFFFNSLTSWCYLRVPRIGIFRSGGILSLARAARLVSMTRTYRDVVIVGILQVALTVTAAYQLSHIEGPLAFNPAFIFALTLGGLIGAYLTAKLLALLGNRVSFRSLLFLNHFILCICGLAWLLIHIYPTEWHESLAAILYILSTMMLAMSSAVWTAMASTHLPQELRLQVSTIYMLSSVLASGMSLGLVALLRGSLAGYLDNPYAFAYVPWVILCICICIWAILRRSDGDPDILSELRQLKPSNIQSIYNMQRVNQQSAVTNRNRVRQIEHALLANTPATRESMLQYLSSFHVNERLGAIWSLLDKPNKRAYRILAEEAQNKHSPLRTEAITALGFSNNQEYVPLLQRCAEEAPERIQACALKSLLRLNAAPDDDAIIARYHGFEDYRSRYELIIGLSENKRSVCLRRILIDEGKAGADKQWLITIALQWTDTFGKQRRLESFLQLELEREGEGIQDVLLECISNDALKDNWQDIMRAWQEQHRIEDLIKKDEQFWPVRDANDALLQLLMPFYIPLEVHPPAKT